MSGVESFQTGSGLTDEFDFGITDALYAYDVKYGNGEIPLLKLTGTNSVTGATDESIWLKCGSNVEIIEGGAALTFVRGNKINRSSQYGKWIDAFVSHPDGIETIKARNMDALRAASWIGLTLSVRRVFKTTKIDGRDVEMQEWAIDGIEITDAPKKEARGRAAAKAKAAAAEPADDSGIPDELAVSAGELAKAHDTHEEYVDALYEAHPELATSDPPLPYEDEITSEAYYKAAREG